MNREEAKQYLTNQIDYSIKPQDEYNKNRFYLCYNKSYIRAKKLSKITGQTVNKNNFKGGEPLFEFNKITKEIWYCPKIWIYLKENYSKVHKDRINLLQEVINEYGQYNGYKAD